MSIDKILHSNNSHGGCFHPDSLIQTLFGLTPIRDITPHDVVCSMINGVLRYSRVVKLVKIPYNGIMYLIDDYVSLTAFHPYRDENGVIAFPIDSNLGLYEYNGYVYDIILEDRGLLVTCGKVYATWGHDSHEGIFEHQFFGSERVVGEINNISRDYEVELPVNCFRRDRFTNLIVGFNF